MSWCGIPDCDVIALMRAAAAESIAPMPVPLWWYGSVAVALLLVAMVGFVMWRVMRNWR